MNIADTIQKLTRGTVEVISLDGLKEKLQESQKNNKPLHIKAGFDPTAPDMHLGHVVLLRKLRQFQDIGHKVFFLIGDFTAQVGDPTGRDQTRPKITRQQVVENAKSYKDQVFKILDKSKTEVVFNSDWLDKLSSQQVLELTAHSSVAQMLARADFKKRFEEKKEISLLEFVYPLLQGYDSVYLKADVELGGSDQRFNLLMGRQLQEVYGQKPQVVLMTPLLEGTDGVNKMSKSLNNYIGINESGKEIFGKVMSISDELMFKYYECLTDFDLKEIKLQHPKEAKVQLAHHIVKWFHGESAAEAAKKDFEQTFSQGLIPEDVQEYSLKKGKATLAEILVDAKVVSSKRDFVRLIQQGAISFEGDKIENELWTLKTGTLKVGKRRFLKLID
jgi:tyrosyl-tRNA synthetase